MTDNTKLAITNPIADAINKVVTAKAGEIMNKGVLNSEFYYFETDHSTGNGKLIRNSKRQLDCTSKYYTIAADVIVFNKNFTHVLMEFRCPHHVSNYYSDIIDEASSFQYKGCLGTPSGFFNANKDIHEDGSPNFVKLAERQIKELGFLQSGTAVVPDCTFIGAVFNNYRDVRWYYSRNYVPTVGLQFALVLDDFDLPKPKPSQACLGLRKTRAPAVKQYFGLISTSLNLYINAGKWFLK
ncbi:hypothetical protein HK100_002413 [Physocladia obscura]|uniref:Uncharacterized protein n=1 Tax=Physocladia obscura TaxID=109957 RepID=A0AAD5XDV4_9FUNG|nr:hypothetical protein HK100_002413 [Physocladia obscura]